jgi:Tol biopolymer transport system component
MNRERWKKIEELFQQGSELAPADRAAFLDGACGNDMTLRADLEALLRAHNQAGDFLEPSPAPPDLAGRSLGNYQVTELVGVGGMGEVYRARDLKLKREVAIKVLPDVFLQDKDRLARFQQEAEMLASLNHPHIGSIYDLEEIGGRTFLVLEFLEGETLAKRLARGAIPVREALKIAVQIADALQAAHDRGVIHRDLKPGNIQLSAGGNIKVLDFGLAKPAGDRGNAATSSSFFAATTPGLIMGTAAYMSPEQAEGRPADKRSDVWSFGVVLYEMLTGRRPFEGKSVPHIVVRVIEETPDWSLLPPLPNGVRDLIQRCLRKDPNERLRDIGDVRIHLESALTAPAPVNERRPKAAGRLHWWGIGAAAVALAVAAFLYSVGERPVDVPASPVRFEIPQPIGVNAYDFVTISPDGRHLAFVGISVGKGQQIWIRSLETQEARPLEGTEGVRSLPFWSADSRFMTFTSNGKLRKIDILGGPAQELAPVQGSVVSGFWTPNETIVYSDLEFGLFQVSTRGGTPTPYGQGNLSSLKGILLPVALPNDRILYCQCSGDVARGIFVASPDGETQRILPDESAIVYVPARGGRPAYILFTRGAGMLGMTATLMAQPFDAETAVTVGEPIRIADAVPAAGFSASSNGVLVYREANRPVPADVPGMLRGQLTWFNRGGTVTSTVGDEGIFRIAALSPNDTQAALELAEPGGQNIDVYVLEFARGTNNRFSFDPLRDISPVWSPDGRKILYTRLSDHSKAFWYQKSANLAGKEELVLELTPLGVPSSWSRDGDFVLYNTIPAPADIFAVDITAPMKDRVPVPLVTSEFNDVNPRFSPDGTAFAYASNDSGLYQIYVQPFDRDPERRAAAGRVMVSRNGAGTGGAVWRADGKELFYIAADQMLMSVEMATTQPLRPLAPSKPLFKVPQGILFFDVSNDGRRFLMAVPSVGVVAPPFKVVLNWTSALGGFTSP